LGLMRKIDPELRLPLCPMGQDTREKLIRVLKDTALI